MYITVSFAQSIDGRIATKTGDSQWISGEETLELAQELRRDNDVILVGIGTVLRDDPLLTCRIADHADPVRVVLDSGLALPEDSQIAATAHRVKTIVFHNSTDTRAIEKLSGRNVECLYVDRSEDGLNLNTIVDFLGSRGFGTVFVEGGSRVITSFFKAGFVNRLICVIAPMIIGEGTSAVNDLGVERLGQAMVLETRSVSQKGKDIVWDLEVQ